METLHLQTCVFSPLAEYWPSFAHIWMKTQHWWQHSPVVCRWTTEANSLFFVTRWAILYFIVNLVTIFQNDQHLKPTNVKTWRNSKLFWRTECWIFKPERETLFCVRNPWWCPLHLVSPQVIDDAVRSSGSHYQTVFQGD